MRQCSSRSLPPGESDQGRESATFGAHSRQLFAPSACCTSSARTLRSTAPSARMPPQLQTRLRKRTPFISNALPRVTSRRASPACLWRRTTGWPRGRASSSWFHFAGPLHGLDVGGARALGALLDLVLHLIVLLQRLEPARLDGREVHEEILAAVIGRDEAEALGVVEPLYGTCTHVCFLDIDWKEGRHRKRGGPAENQGENQPTRTVRTATTRPATRCLRILLYRYTGIRARSPV